MTSRCSSISSGVLPPCTASSKNKVQGQQSTFGLCVCLCEASSRATNTQHTPPTMHTHHVLNLQRIGTQLVVGAKVLCTHRRVVVAKTMQRQPTELKAQAAQADGGGAGDSNARMQRAAAAHKQEQHECTQRYTHTADDKQAATSPHACSMRRVWACVCQASSCAPNTQHTPTAHSHSFACLQCIGTQLVVGAQR